MHSPHCSRREVYEPTPSEIRRACEAIQRTWTARERLQRIVSDEVRRIESGRQMVPSVACREDELLGAIGR